MKCASLSGEGVNILGNKIVKQTCHLLETNFCVELGHNIMILTPYAEYIEYT